MEVYEPCSKLDTGGTLSNEDASTRRKKRFGSYSSCEHFLHHIRCAVLFLFERDNDTSPRSLKIRCTRNVVGVISVVDIAILIESENPTQPAFKRKSSEQAPT